MRLFLVTNKGYLLTYLLTYILSFLFIYLLCAQTNLSFKPSIRPKMSAN